MGRECIKLEIDLMVSRHNSDEDKIDDGLVDDMVEEIKKVIENKKYNKIMPCLFW